MGWARGSLEDGVAKLEPPPINPQATSVHCSQPHPQASVTPQGKGVERHTSGYLPGATPSLWALHGGQDKQRNSPCL